ncbi:MAG TPA: glycine cleavage system protein GcvH [Chloroflexi bacterium]|nr:glycine cleavage system protein GcvH [Chloroflexota bacterium]
MNPRDCKYSKEHEWVRLEGGLASVGITDYAQDQLGDIVYVELPPLGEILTQFEPFGVVESVKAASDLYAPLSGEVLEVNEELSDHPEFVNEDPYGQGWMIKIEPSDTSQLDNLLTAEEYEKYLKGLE